MLNIKDTITALSLCMSITGHERRIFDTVKSIAEPYFDEIYDDVIGNLLLMRRCGKENAPCIMLDAHLDEIGMIVTSIKDGGFLTVTNIGGIDTRILPASILTVYGSEGEFPAVVVSTPPHLQQPGDDKKLPKIGEILLDTGYPKEVLEKIAPIGTPVGFEPVVTELKNNLIAGKGFDDKACAAIILAAVSAMEKPDSFDVCVSLTTREEVSGVGARCAVYGINPKAVIVFDVNFAAAPDSDKNKTLPMGGGPGISISAVTHRRLTRNLIACAKEQGIKHNTIVEIKSTGTNADGLPTLREGMAVSVMSLPLKNMHTPSEILSLDDAEECAKLLGGFAARPELWNFEEEN